MPVTPTYPGVYIEEIPSGVRTITGVSTSVTAFVGYTARGPVNEPIRIFNIGDYEREFGGLHRDSLVSYAVRQFFLNGGSEAWVVRVAAGAVAASVGLKNGTNGGAISTLQVTAKSEGDWGNLLRIDVDYNTTNPDSTFNLRVQEFVRQGSDLALNREEAFRNLSMDGHSSQYAVNVVSSGSKLIDLTRHGDVTGGVLSGLAAGWSLSGDLSGLTLPGDLSDEVRVIAVEVDGDGPYEVALFPRGGIIPANLDDLATALQNAVRGINPGLDRFANFTVQRANALGTPDAAGNFLLLTSGTPADATREHSAVRISNAASDNAARVLRLGLANGGRERAAAADLRPSQTGTVSGDLADVDLTTLDPTDQQVGVSIQDGATVIAGGTITLGSPVSSLPELASQLQDRLRAMAPTNPAVSRLSVTLVGTRLRVLSPAEQTDATVTFADASGGSLAADIKLDAAGAAVNVQKYAPGVGADRGAQENAVAGNDGTPPNATLLRGSRADKTGLYALEDVDIFNILCIPETADLDETAANAVLAEAVAYCNEQRAFLIVDPPRNRNSVPDIEDWMTNVITPDKNAATYFPYVQVADPLDDFRLKAFPPSGTIAGLYARTDSNRGVWKSPAGTEATLSNVQGLAYTLTDAENGVLNPLGINCLRSFPVYRRVSWGARTLEGSDQQASEWKYVPVRRVALFIEESLYRGTQWVVFEPNDESLWAQIRLNVGAFMQSLFREGAFQGKTPREAYLVKCDKETTTQDDINRGIVNILVGFAPLKPAEFVILKIQQLAGQIQT